MLTRVHVHVQATPLASCTCVGGGGQPFDNPVRCDKLGETKPGVYMLGSHCLKRRHVGYAYCSVLKVSPDRGSVVWRAGSPHKSAQVGNNTSPVSARTFNCATYSFFGSADSRNEHSIESPHSTDAWSAKAAGKEPTPVDKSEAGSDSAPDGSANASERTPSVKQESDVEEPARSHAQTGTDEDLGVPTDEEILMSHLNLGPGF